MARPVGAALARVRTSWRRGRGGLAKVANTTY
nr:MAG TPA: hypothetical protein [Caudoviricetes sp.]